MIFPIDDWQFWTVTLTAGGAIWALVKPFVGGGKKAAGPCAKCGVGAGSPCRSSNGLVKLGTHRPPATR